jgi:hypothetical protein
MYYSKSSDATKFRRFQFLLDELIKPSTTVPASASKTVRIATLEEENMEVHEITSQGLWGGVTILLLIWSAGFSLPVICWF